MPYPLTARRRAMLTERRKDQRTGAPIESQFVATINWAEDRGEYFYFGYTPSDPQRGQWGCARYYPDTQAAWGIVAVRIL